MTRIAFLCTGNSCRSQMAEGFARAFAKAGVEVYSAGIAPIGLNPRTTEAMREAGIDISAHASKPLDGIPKELDYVVTVCGNADKSCPNLAGRVERLHWDIPDPKLQGSEEEIREDFRRVREIVRERVLAFLKERNLSKS